jgi:hypothetical protein
MSEDRLAAEGHFRLRHAVPEALTGTRRHNDDGGRLACGGVGL